MGTHLFYFKDTYIASQFVSEFNSSHLESQGKGEVLIF